MNKQRKMVVSPDALKSLGISLDELKRHVVELRSLLGERFNKVAPAVVNDSLRLHWLVNLSMNLSKLKSCKGFGRHVEMYDGRQTKHAYFVAEIAGFLYDNGATIELEPPVGNGKRADILATLKDGVVYVECKGIETAKFNFTREHERVLSLLRPYLNAVPHQIGVTYKRTPSDEEIGKLGQAISERARLVTADGKLIDNSNLNVTVVRRSGFGVKGMMFRIAGIEEELSEKCRYPIDVFWVDGLSVSIAGPKVDYKGVLRDCIRKSKSQSNSDQPFVLVIDGSLMLGALVENLRALTTAFQPETNTRFSGAVLCNSNSIIGSVRTNLDFTFIANPFAKHPIGKSFELLFGNSNRTQG